MANFQMSQVRDPFVKEPFSKLKVYEDENEIEDKDIIHKALDHLMEFNNLEGVFNGIESDKLKKILKTHVAVYEGDDEKNTLLHVAVTMNCRSAVLKLLQLGAEINALNAENATPLHLACSKKIAKILLKHGADIDAKDKYNSTPLSEAVTNNYDNLIRFLLKKGANSSLAKEYFNMPQDCDDEELFKYESASDNFF